MCQILFAAQWVVSSGYSMQGTLCEDVCYLLEWTTVHKQELDAFSRIFSQHFLRQISIFADVSIKC